MLVHRARDNSTRLADSSSPRRDSASSANAARCRWSSARGGDDVTAVPHRPCIVCGARSGRSRPPIAHTGRSPSCSAGAPRDRVELTRTQAPCTGCSIRSCARARKASVSTRPDDRYAPRRRDTLRLPDLADTLEAIARRGSRVLYHGGRARAIVATVRDGGGELTHDDLAAYRVVWRRPVRAPFRGATVVSNPPPSSGGVLIAYGLALLERLDGADAGSAEAIAALVEVMREQTRVRGDGFTRDLHRGGLAGCCSPSSCAPPARASPVALPAGAGARRRARRTSRRWTPTATRPRLSTSTGSGLGRDRPRNGRVPRRRARRVRPRRRQARFARSSPHEREVAPSIVLGRDGMPRLVVGRAGSARLRGAIMQIVVNVVEHGLLVDEAIRAARAPRRAARPLRGRRRRGRAARGDGLRRRPLGAAQPVLRRRRGGPRRGRRLGSAAAGEQPAARRSRPSYDPSRRGGRPGDDASASRPDTRIRRAEPGDAAALVALLNDVGAEPRVAAQRPEPPERRRRERRYVRSVRRHPDAALLVAELDGQIVGRLSIARDPHPSSAHVADFGLTVAAAYRRRGVGTALLAGCRANGPAAPGPQARTARLPRTTTPRSPSTSRTGYVREGYRDGQPYRLPDGRFVDVILMAKLL